MLDRPREGLESLITKHAAIFKDELGTIQLFKAKLQDKQNATPRFFKSRSVPFAIKEVTETNFNCFEAAGILKKVTYSE